LYYTIVYVLTALGSFGVILMMGRKGFEAEELEDYKGLYARDPVLALMMMMLMFSTAGVPPFVGFWAKWRIFQELWATNHTVLVMVGAAVSVIGVFYYLRVVKLMYFDAPVDRPLADRQVGVRFALGLNAAAVLVLGVLPSPLLDLCSRLIK
jgi:NADH-quinone oxidoreductase subunit N